MSEEMPAQTDTIEEVMRRFEQPLLQFATRIIGDRDRARDIVQETFVKFGRNGSTPSEGRAATWLFTVCRNAALNVCRKERRMLYLDEELLDGHATEQRMPFERLEQKESAGFLLRIVATLPPRQQEVLQLKFQNGLSYREIAEITRTSANNVGVLIHTALKTLRHKYTNASRDFLPFEPRTS